MQAGGSRKDLQCITIPRLFPGEGGGGTWPVHNCADGPLVTCHNRVVFKLVIGVRRGSACNIPGAWQHHRTLEQARAAAGAALRLERVTRIAIVRNEAEPVFVEWVDR